MGDFIVGAAPVAGADMGLGAGGTTRQEIYADEWPVADDQPHSTRVFVHLRSASQWRAITNEEPPGTPASAHAYTQAGLPWFDYYVADAADLPPSQALSDWPPRLVIARAAIPVWHHGTGPPHRCEVQHERASRPDPGCSPATASRAAERPQLPARQWEPSRPG